MKSPWHNSNDGAAPTNGGHDWFWFFLSGVRRFIVLSIAIVTVSACSEITYEKTTAEDVDDPEGFERAIRSNEVGSIFGEGGLFGNDNRQGGQGGIGVNAYLWRATLDTIAFLPITVADPFGGVVLTDWRESVEFPDERFKLNVYILGTDLRADGVRVTVLKQVLKEGQWRDAPVEAGVGVQIEDAILSRARQFRRAALASQ